MSELSDELKSLELNEEIFKDIKFYVSGRVADKAVELLKSGGAERMNYFTDYVTHLICGEDCDENDLSDATDIYEVPALSEKWIFICAQLKTLVNTKPFIYNTTKLFTNFVFCFSRIGKDRNNLWGVITYHGGILQLNFNLNVTHLVTTQCESEKYKKAAELENVVIITPDWIYESVKNKSLVESELFHPKLILYPKVIKRPDTTSITGFEPEVSEKEQEIEASDSTQALLDKLKQRMPWNQPAEAPPNVVAPSFTGQTKQPEQRIFSPTSQAPTSNSSNQVPRSIVHHTPNQPTQFANFQSNATNNPNFNRILEQLQRPNLQGINRLNPQQQQQFLQKQNQLMNQQNVVQRHILKQVGPGGQLIQQQQLIRQQVVGNSQMIVQNPNMQQLVQKQRILVSQQGQPNIILQKQLLQNQQQQQINMEQNNQQQNQNQQQGQTIIQNQVLQQQLNQGQGQLIGQPSISQNQNILHQQQQQTPQSQTSQLINQQQNILNQQQQNLTNQQQNVTNQHQNHQNQNLMNQQQQQNLINQQSIMVSQSNLINPQHIMNQQHIANQQQSTNIVQQGLINQQNLLNQQQQNLLNQQGNILSSQQGNMIGTQQGNVITQSQQGNIITQSQQGSIIGQSQQSNIINSQQGNIITSQQGNIISSQQNIITSQQANIMTSQQGNLINSQQGNIMSTQQGNMLNSSQGNIINSQQGNLISIQQGNLISTQQNNIIASQQGNLINSQGNIIGTQQGNVINSQQGNIITSQQGNIINSQGNLINSQGNLINAQGNIIGTQQIIQQQGNANQPQQQIVNQQHQTIITQQPTVVNQQQMVNQQAIVNQQNIGQQQQTILNQQGPHLQQQQQNQQGGNIITQSNQQGQQHIVISSQNLIPQNMLSQSPQQQNIQNLINQQQHINQQTFTSMGIQQGKIIQSQFGAQQINQQTNQAQFVGSANNQNFQQQQQPQQQQQHFIQNQFVQGQQPQQQQPQLVQTNQFNQTQVGQQIVNQQQIIGQQMQNKPQHILVNQQPTQPGFQQQQQNPQQRPVWQQQIIRHPGGVNVVQQPGARVQWAGGTQIQPPVQRQYIHLDAQTHQQLQQMAPEQRTLFVQKLQKQRLLSLQRQQLLQHQQRGGGQHILIRSSGPVPPGLSPQQHVQWLQQHASKQGIVLQQNIQPPQPAPTPQPPQQPPQQAVQNIQPPQTPQPLQQQQQQHAPGLSPIQTPQPQQQPPFNEQNLQIQRQQLRLQQLQMQREQAQKNAQTLHPGQIPVRPQTIDPNATVIDANQQTPLVNSKTKTALANMLSIRLQSGGSAMGPGPEPITEPSAAGTLRLMTAQHNATLNSNNRAQEILALQQGRVINAPTRDIIRPPVPTPVPQSPQNEPPKLQYSPRNVPPIQHRPGTFYGHNPNLKLPPDLFLLGCIFVVVELERFLEESMPGWQRKIEKHGGEIEKQYCSRVTHVLCETQRHGVVMQALRDYKRCVTLYWLSDVMHRKQVLPPWTALHLPTMYLDTVPASKHLISLTGFSGIERDRVKHMIKYTGATLTNYFSKHNTLLIATKPEGPKYMHAKKWNIPVVNIQWLTDVMLGNFSALNQMEHMKYQQFSNPINFHFDPALVPNLMHAWKMPINISQESYERVKRSASPVLTPNKVKKIKTEHCVDENENLENMPQSTTHRILFSKCTDVKELKNIVTQLGGSLAKGPTDATHLVLPQLLRTTKLLHCVCLGTKITSESWLRDSQTAKVFLDETTYSLDTKEFNSKYKCDFEQTMATRNRNKLLEGKFFFITPSVFPNRKMLTEIIQSCGGVVERTRRTLSQIETTNVSSPYSYIILTHAHDLHLVADLLKNKKDKIRIVCNVELILSAILKQTFEVDPYIVKVV